jgi:hypothetical protein
VKPLGFDLCDPLRAVEILELHQAEVSERDLGAELVLDQLPRRGRQQHLAAVGDRADARSSMDGEPDVPSVVRRRLAGVDADASAQLDARPARGAGRGPAAPPLPP